MDKKSPSPVFVSPTRPRMVRFDEADTIAEGMAPRSPAGDVVMEDDDASAATMGNIRPNIIKSADRRRGTTGRREGKAPAFEAEERARRQAECQPALSALEEEERKPMEYADQRALQRGIWSKENVAARARLAELEPERQRLLGEIAVREKADRDFEAKYGGMADRGEKALAKKAVYEKYMRLDTEKLELPK